MERGTDRKKRVLVVDDEPAIGDILRIKLGHSGFEVTTTISGAEAIDLIRTREIDAVLLDILMPEVTGMDVLDRVRTFSRVPIIVFATNPDVVRFALDNGATDVIAKPFDIDQLVDKLRSILSNTARHKS